MRYFIPAIALAATAAIAEPVSCRHIEKERVLVKPECRCVIKDASKGDEKLRIITQTCLDAFLVLNIGDAWIDGKWVKIAYTYCEKLDDAELYSCKGYNYTQDNWENNANIFSRTPSKLKDYLREVTDPGDLRYLFPKKGK